MGVKLVALDIDGTIIPQDYIGPPSPRLRRAVSRLSEAGIIVVLASGRMFPGTRAMALELGLATPVICQQGCSIHTLDGATLHEFPIDRQVALDIVAYAREIERPYEWFNPVRYIASLRTLETEEYARVSGITAEYRPDPECSGVTPTGVGIVSPSSQAAGAVHRELASRHADTCHLLDFPLVTVAVASEANKGHALSLLCADFGIDRHETVAIGDSVNDAPMLAWAGRGYALAHSDRYALDAAHEVLPDGDEPLAALLESIA